MNTSVSQFISFEDGSRNNKVIIRVLVYQINDQGIPLIDNIGEFESEDGVVDFLNDENLLGYLVHSGYKDNIRQFSNICPVDAAKDFWWELYSTKYEAQHAG